MEMDAFVNACADLLLIAGFAWAILTGYTMVTGGMWLVPFAALAMCSASGWVLYCAVQRYRASK